MAKCVKCKFLKYNPDYDYLDNPDSSICSCEKESDLYPGEIQVLGFEEEVPCDDFEEGAEETGVNKINLPVGNYYGTPYVINDPKYSKFYICVGTEEGLDEFEISKEFYESCKKEFCKEV